MNTTHAWVHKLITHIYLYIYSQYKAWIQRMLGSQANYTYIFIHLLTIKNVNTTHPWVHKLVHVYIHTFTHNIMLEYKTCWVHKLVHVYINKFSHNIKLEYNAWHIQHIYNEMYKIKITTIWVWRLYLLMIVSYNWLTPNRHHS